MLPGIPQLVNRRKRQALMVFYEFYVLFGYVVGIANIGNVKIHSS